MNKDYFTQDDPVNRHIFRENFDENRKRILKEWKARKEQIMTDYDKITRTTYQDEVKAYWKGRCDKSQEDNKRLKSLLTQAQVEVCSMNCPSVKKTGTEWPHCKLCKEITEALKGKEQIMSKVSDIKILKQIELDIIGDISGIVNYAGNAFFYDDKEEMKFWKGQYIALDRTRKRIQQQWLLLSIKKPK